MKPAQPQLESDLDVCWLKPHPSWLWGRWELNNIQMKKQKYKEACLELKKLNKSSVINTKVNSLEE